MLATKGLEYSRMVGDWLAKMLRRAQN